MDTFRVRLNCVDHYQTEPTHFDPGLPYESLALNNNGAVKVPVVRVFGATEGGQKVCAHIHGAFPYLYIEYDGDLDTETVTSYIQHLRLAINHALAVSYRRNEYDGKASFVAHISLVKGIPFYGFHVGFKHFCKIYLLNPLHMTRFGDLLRQGTIMKRKFQPYESHMQYLAQWMCDYNLFGCAYIDCQSVMFRGPVPLDSDTKPGHEWNSKTIKPYIVSDPEVFPIQSSCSIEVDIMVKDIVNRKNITARDLHQDFIERKFPIDPAMKLVTSMAGLWKDETQRRKAALPSSDPGTSPFPAEVLISMSADSRSDHKGGWIHEQEFSKKVRLKINRESSSQKISYDSFVGEKDGEESIQTALESIEELYPENIRPIDILVEPPVDFEDGDIGNQSDYDDNDCLPAGYQTFQNNSDHNLSEENGTRDDAYRIEEDAEPGFPDCSFATDPDAVGVRPYGDLNRYKEDLFPIPDCFKSIVQKSKNQPSKFVLDSTPSSPQNKRRKLNEDGIDQTPERPKPHAKFNSSQTKQQLQKASGPRQSARLKKTTMSQDIPSSQESIQMVNTSTIKAFKVAKSSQLSSGSPQKTNNKVANSQEHSNQKKSDHTALESGDNPFAISLTGSFRSLPSEADTAQLKQLADNLIPFPLAKNSDISYVFGSLPPKSATIDMHALGTGHLPNIYQDAYYSDERDVPKKARDYAGREFKLESRTVPYLPEFDPSGMSSASRGFKQPLIVDMARNVELHRKRSYACRLRNWEIASAPPTRIEVEMWYEREQKQRIPALLSHKPAKALSQIEESTPKNSGNSKFAKRAKPITLKSETQYMSIMSLEVHVNTREDLLPDPAKDGVECIYWSFRSDEVESDVNCRLDGTYAGILALSLDENAAAKMKAESGLDVDFEESELQLFDRMAEIVQILDPDILTGFEVHNSSWGYLIERARTEYGLSLCDDFSRMRVHSHGRFGKENDRWGFNNTSTVRVTGRHMINIWRAMQSELNLLQYTLENVAFQLLQRRVPHYPWKDLSRWYQSERSRDIGRVLDYHLSRCLLNLEILEQTEIVPRISEQARLLGVDFFSVISRGSQFKVESLMFRIAKPENLILISPDRKQVGAQNALECLPLVMEPQSNFYTSPVLVLDFQSLYPSIMIAYNYCYSTFLGRVNEWRGRNKMGFIDYERPDRLLELLDDEINISPNGMMYCKPTIRKSLLAKMLCEILETRVMVKSGMKLDKEDKFLQRLLNNRQLALKLIANVTYGYTSASFSGRMPCSEIADSIVQTGRETLERTIALIHSVEKWGAEVVYGDTDSLFVHLKGRTKAEAFDIGEDIAKTVTKRNPRPIKLKFEKVYLPCILLAKKRYVGYKYEHRDQQVPDFDAKGIETIRRDGTPAEQKIEERALRTLFETADLSQVKKYFQAQCDKIMKGNVSIQDFCFAKEVRLGTYSEKGPPPPGALISTRKMLADPRAEPQYGERVPYVVVSGAPGARLIDRCVAPEVLLKDNQTELDAEYYISKNLIPPLERIFNLVGANVRAWYDEMPKTQRVRMVGASSTISNSTDASKGQNSIFAKKTLEAYMKTSVCSICRGRIEDAQQADEMEQSPWSVGARSGKNVPICTACLRTPDNALFELRGRRAARERAAIDILAVCRACTGLAHVEDVRCDSKDCNVFYTRVRMLSKLDEDSAVEGPLVRMLEDRLDLTDW